MPIQTIALGIVLSVNGNKDAGMAVVAITLIVYTSLVPTVLGIKHRDISLINGSWYFVGFVCSIICGLISGGGTSLLLLLTLLYYMLNMMFVGTFANQVKKKKMFLAYAVIWDALLIISFSVATAWYMVTSLHLDQPKHVLSPIIFASILSLIVFAYLAQKVLFDRKLLEKDHVQSKGWSFGACLLGFTIVIYFTRVFGDYLSVDNENDQAMAYSTAAFIALVVLCFVVFLGGITSSRAEVRIVSCCQSFACHQPLSALCQEKTLSVHAVV